MRFGIVLTFSLVQSKTAFSRSLQLWWLVVVAVVTVMHSVEWESTDGLLKSISVGRSGVWGANKNGNIYYRQDTYGDPTNIGSSWIQTDGG